MTAQSARNPRRHGRTLLRGAVLGVLLALLGAAWFGQHTLQYGAPREPGAKVLLGAVAVLTIVQALFGLGSPDDPLRDAADDDDPEAPFSVGELCALAAIAAVGVFFRFVHFYTVPDGMNHDAAWYGMYALEIARGTPYTPYISAAWGRETLFMYLAAPFLPFWGNSPELVQFTSTVVGILTFVPMYLFARAVLGRRLALVALAFFVVSGWHNVFSRAGWRVITVPPAFALMLWAFWRARQTQRAAYWLAMGAACGLAINTYNAGRIAPVMMTVLCLALLERARWRRTLAGGALAAVAFLIVGAPMLWYATQHFVEWQGRAEFFVEQQDHGATALHNLLDAARMFNYRVFGGNDFFITEPILEPLAGALFVVGLATTLRFVRRRDHSLMLLGFALALVPGIFSSPNANRCITAMPFVYLFVARGLGSFADGCAALAPGRWRRAVGLALLALPAAIAAVESYREFLGADRRPIYGFNAEATAVGEFMKPFTNRFKTYVISSFWPEYTTTYLSYDGRNSPLERYYVWVQRYADAEQDIDALTGKGLLFMLDLGAAGNEALHQLQARFPVHRLQEVRARRRNNDVVARAFIVDVEALRAAGPWSNSSLALLVRSRAGDPVAAATRCFEPIAGPDGVSARLSIMLPEVGAAFPVGEIRWLPECPPAAETTPLWRLSIGPSGVTHGADALSDAIPRARLESGHWYDVTAVLSAGDRSAHGWIDGRPAATAPLGTGPLRLAGVQVVADHADEPAGRFFVDRLAALSDAAPPTSPRWRESPPAAPAFAEDFDNDPRGPLLPEHGWRELRGLPAIVAGPNLWAPALATTNAGEVNAFAGGNGTRPGQFAETMGVAEDPAGNIYVSERSNHRVQKFAPDGTPLLRWGKLGDAAGQFREPLDLAADDEFLYVVDTWNNRVQIFDWNGTFHSQFNGPPHMITPRGIFVQDGKVYVADSGSGVIRIFDRTGKYLQAIGQLGSGPGQLEQPVDVVVDSTGRIFATNPGNNRIEIFAPDGRALGSFPVRGWQGTGLKENYLFIDETDIIHLTDWGTGHVRRFTPDGTELQPLGPRIELPTGVSGRHDRLLVALRGECRLVAMPRY